jgi:hypothetical protein
VTSTVSARKILIGIAAFVVAIVAIAFAIGGGSSSTESAGRTSHSLAAVPGHVSAGKTTGTLTSVGAPVPVPRAGSGGEGGASGSVAGGLAGTSGGHSASFAADSTSSALAGTAAVSATRVVKTGTLELQVKKGAVGATVTSLVDLTSRYGGYVASSQTNDVDSSPTGEVVLRIPVNNFEGAITAADRLGKQISLQTNADDVTGRYVDLAARKHALERTRHTYLTILRGAHTIGETLSVQQQIDEVQQQIEELQGRLKVLRNQSNDGTLTINVTQEGSPSPVPVSHERHGFSLAWHNSVDRFNRGLQGIIGALGPLLLAALLIAAAYGVIRLVIRFAGRRTSDAPTS